LDKNDLLAWLGVLLGVPALIELFVQHQYAIAVLIFIQIGVLIWLFFFLNRPAYTLLEVAKTLTIHDPGGKSATLTRTQWARPNQSGLSQFWCKNLGADGEIKNIRIDGKPVSATDMRVSCRVLSIRKIFDKRLGWRKKFRVEVAYDLEDSFCAAEESLIHSVDYDTKVLKMRIELPKKCFDAQFFYRLGDDERKAGEIDIREDRLVLDAQCRNPKIGADYYVSWTW
jgi:hypothetical protein